MSGSKVSREALKKLLRNFPSERRYLINFLHEVQKEFGYIPEEGVKILAEHFSVTPAEIFGLATFYASFRIEKQPDHEIQVCHGTACHVRGARAIMEEFSRHLEEHFGPEDWRKKVSLKKVNCLGCCAIGPVAMVDGQIQSKLTPAKVKSLVRKLAQSEGKIKNKDGGQSEQD